MVRQFGPWSAVMTCKAHGAIGEVTELSDARQARLAPYWQRAAVLHHQVCKSEVTVTWTNSDAPDGVRSITTTLAEITAPNIPYKRLEEIISFPQQRIPAEEVARLVRASEIVAMATELARYRARGVLNTLDDLEDDAENDDLLTKPIEEIQAELRTAGYTDADQVQHVHQMKHMIKACVERNAALLEITRLQKRVEELEHPPGSQEESGRLQDLIDQLRATTPDRPEVELSQATVDALLSDE